MSPAGVLFATFAVLMLLGSPITVALGVAEVLTLPPQMDVIQRRLSRAIMEGIAHQGM